ncbi:MAG: carbon starvation CstA family protein [Bryobacteraceae bacterium]
MHVSRRIDLHGISGRPRDGSRATPAERLREGHDYRPANKWIVSSQHFTALTGPGRSRDRRRLRSSAV